jgi:hypothetical protein
MFARLWNRPAESILLIESYIADKRPTTGKPEKLGGNSRVLQ